MKKAVIIAVSLLLSLKGYNQLFTYTFNGTGTCPTQGSSLASQPANATVSAVTRNGALSCSSTNDCFNSIGWSTSASIDQTQYIEVTITAASGYVVNVSGIGFTTMRSSTGPVNGRVAHDGGTGTFSATSDFSVTTSLSSVNWGFSTFSGTTGGVVKFRVYGWTATNTSTGTMRIDDFYVNATVTATSPLSIDYANSLVGISKTPTQKLDVNGNIRASGKVFVGNIADSTITTLTDYSLAVNGQALFTKARVLLQNAWPDYVFDNNYALLPLPELEVYINKNQHLPELAAASEAEEEGIDIAATQSVLLKKIEELTLYIIQQDKTITALQEKNKQVEVFAQRLTVLEELLKKINK